MNFKKMFSLLAVMASSLIVLATSVVQHTFNGGNFRANSDCAGAPATLDVTVSNNQVVAPTGVTFLTLGFPTQSVENNQSSTGVLGAVTRECRPTYSDGDQGEYIYSCFDNGVLACTIHLAKR